MENSGGFARCPAAAVITARGALEKNDFCPRTKPLLFLGRRLAILATTYSGARSLSRTAGIFFYDRQIKTKLDYTNCMLVHLLAVAAALSPDGNGWTNNSMGPEH